MKTIVVLCAAISVALVLGGCADQNTAAANTAQHAAADPNSVGSVYGGPAPGHIKQRYEP